MSIKDKLQAFRKELIADVDKKSKELLRLKSEVDYLIGQGRKEIIAESNKLDAGYKLLANEKDRFEKYKIRTEKEIEEERKSAEARIDRHLDGVIEYFEELKAYGKPPQIIDSYIKACFILDEKLANRDDESCCVVFQVAECHDGRRAVQLQQSFFDGGNVFWRQFR